MKVHVPLHITANWIGEEIAREMRDRKSGKQSGRTKYIHAKNLSIRQFIAKAEQLKKL